jgi:hypothetical protein
MLPRGARRVKLPRNMSGETTVIFKERAIGIKVEQKNSAVVVVKSFHELSPGIPSPAESKVALGDALLSINGESVEFLTYKTLLQKIRASGRPLELRFAKWQNSDDQENTSTHPGAPQVSIDIENPDPIQQALQMAARKRTKVYTGKSFGGAHALRKQERRCFGFIAILLILFMYFLYSRTEGDIVPNRHTSNVQRKRLGNITKVDGNYVTIKLESSTDFGGSKSSEGMNRLKHHFHHDEDVAN